MKIPQILPFFTLCFLGANLVAAPLIDEDFESPGFTNGNDLETYTDWTKDAGAASTAVIDNAEAESGSQSVKLKADSAPTEVTRAVPTNTETIAYYDLFIKPIANESVDFETLINADGGHVAFRLDSTLGDVWVLDGDGTGSSNETPVDTGFSISLDTGDIASDFIRLTWRIDYGANPNTFDLYIDGNMVAADMGVEEDENEPTNITFFGDTDADSYFDDLLLDKDNTIGLDTDNDGLEDSLEIAFGLNVNADDRDSDLDSDGVSNVKEVAAMSPPNFADHGYGSSTYDYYVNSQVGSDTNDGLSAIDHLTHGPFATIQEGLDSAANNDIIGLLPGVGYSPTADLDLGTKTITIKPIGVVTITP